MDQNQNPYGQYPPDPRNYPYNQNPPQQGNQANQYNNGAVQGYQQNPQQGYQQQRGASLSPELSNSSPYQPQYGGPPKKPLSPLAIVIPAAVVVIALVITLIVILSNSGGDSTPGNDDNVPPVSGTTTGTTTTTAAPEPEDYGIQYDASGNPVFTDQTVNNSSLTEYNNRNPYTVDIKINAAGDANKLATVEYGDKKSLEKHFIENMLPTYAKSFDYNVSLFIGDPIKVTYAQPELMKGYEVVYSIPSAVIEGNRHYNGADTFAGMGRYIAIYIDEKRTGDDAAYDADVIDSSYGSANIKGADSSSAYLVIIDMDAWYYGMGIEQVDGVYADGGSGNTNPPTTTTTTAPPTTTTTQAPPSSAGGSGSEPPPGEGPEGEGPPGEGPEGEGPPGEGPPR